MSTDSHRLRARAAQDSTAQTNGGDPDQSSVDQEPLRDAHNTKPLAINQPPRERYSLLRLGSIKGNNFVSRMITRQESATPNLVQRDEDAFDTYRREVWSAELWYLSQENGQEYDNPLGTLQVRWAYGRKGSNYRLA